MKALVIGLGSIARKHIAALRMLDPDVEIVALRSNPHASEEEGVKNVYTLAEAVGEKPDFVIVSTPTACHGDTIETALAIGIPLFIEKPLIHTLPEAERIACRIEKSGKLNYVACNLRFLECLRFLKERLADRDIRINEVNSYCGSWLPGWRPGVDFRAVYSARPELGGGVHIDLIHEIDTLYWLFGMPDAVVRTFRNSSSLGIDAVDYANYCMSYPGFCASVVLNYYRRDYRRTLEIVCEDSTLMVDLARNMVLENGNVIFESSRTIADTYISQMEYFLQLIKSGSTASFNTVADAVATLRMALR